MFFFVSVEEVEAVVVEEAVEVVVVGVEAVEAVVEVGVEAVVAVGVEAVVEVGVEAAEAVGEVLPSLVARKGVLLLTVYYTLACSCNVMRYCWASTTSVDYSLHH